MTKSEHPGLKGIPNLVKIGYTEQTVKEQTKNAEFLEAPAKILSSMECYNLNPNKFENLINGFLHAQRLKMTLIGKDYHPKEWFSIPLDSAREVVKGINDGSIVHYRMDNTTGRLVKTKACRMHQYGLKRTPTLNSGYPFFDLKTLLGLL